MRCCFYWGLPFSSSEDEGGRDGVSCSGRLGSPSCCVDKLCCPAWCCVSPCYGRAMRTGDSEDTQQQIIRETFHLVSKRDENVCNFLEGGLLIGGSDNKLIYRHYATLYFVFCVDSSESELGILDLIQVFVETLDKCFENVCELDLIFHVDKVHNILAEMVMGGMVLETNMNEIVTQIDAQNKLEKSETFIFQSPRQDR
ncbi:PREDICTED: AP-3 complex subunit sigma-1 isoform X2 [Corvus brachyrhynchos]|uniref:AP-3 complex subunit sigma-1 isoform X2 n=1 Tax=Corvus brachyrhynchos TaxID=85066 RepID=UPI0008166697|nr:PREDICTED: AP-3 complex subunit sigma-1 isoform X2 [Corvus brachyrhynchos]